MFREIQRRLKEKFFFHDYIEFNRKLTDQEKIMIHDFVDGKRFMSRYHAGAKKEKVVKVKPPRIKKERSPIGRYCI